MDFQTPPNVCNYMVSMVPSEAKHILEPTPGEGNLVASLVSNDKVVVAPQDFFKLAKYNKFDAVVMNPPFTPMKLGYEILYSCMEISDVIIALMPWLTIINSEKRTKHLTNYGLRSVTHLPRNVFPGSRVQTCILELNNGYKGNTELKFFAHKDQK